MNERFSHLPFDVGPGDRVSRHMDDYLAAYTGGECSELERVAIERHLEGCATCRAALDETQRIRALLTPLGTQATPTSVADAVLTRLAGDSMIEDLQSTGCPVSPSVDVSLSIARREPRRRLGRQPSTWRRWEGAQERDMTTMERDTSTDAQIEAQATHLRRNHDMKEQREGSGRLRSFAAVAAAIALIALGVGIFGLMSHRGIAGLGGQPNTIGTTSGRNVLVDLPVNSTLDGISMDSPTDGWAVGTVFNAPNGMGGVKNALLAHYDGTSWTTSPDSASFKKGMLISVSMVSANEGWAVGSVDGNPVRGLLLHYTGGHWQEVDISHTGFAGGGKLQMVSANEGWLYAPVGGKTSDGQMNPEHKTLVIHYHNGTWQLFSSLPGWAVVSMLSTSDGWALVQLDQMTTLIQRYQDGKWIIMGKVGRASLLTMVSPTEGWMAGTYDSGDISFAGYFDGHLWGGGWMDTNLPANVPSEVEQIAVAAPGDVWIFGRTGTNTQAPKTVAWHYSKGQWTRVDLDFQAFPTGVSMASPTSGWVTGNHGNSAALLRYDQGTWTAVYYGK